MDYALLLDPIYDVLGVPAILTAKGSLSSVAVVAIDKTDGVDVSDRFDVQSLRPAAAIRASEIHAAGLTPGDLDGGTIEFGAKVWRIDAHLLKPNPGGERAGEVFLFVVDEGAYA